MPQRLDVLKTYKLYIDGKFPRTESGRTMPIADAKGRVLAHLCKASRKDLRDAVEAARKAQPGWASATAYLRGQILYRMAEMLDGKRREFAEAIAAVPLKAAGKSKVTPEAEVDASIDRLVAFAGWADKYAQVLGCNNPVSGPFYNFTVPEPTGVVIAVCPDERPLLALVSLFAPALCSGNTAIAIASQANPIPAAVFGEVCATGDVPAGVLNILTAERAELLTHAATHRDVDAVVAANLAPADAAILRGGTAENVKRVAVRTVADWFDAHECHSPWWIESTVEMKTMWHPASV